MDRDKEAYRRHGVESEKDGRYTVSFKRRKEPPKVQHIKTMKKVVRKKGKKRITYYKEKKSWLERLME